MNTLTFKGKTYQVDDDGFLLDFEQWGEEFAEGLAPELEIPQGLSKAHWDVINYIRDTYRERGRCPLVNQTCRANDLLLKDLQSLFPTGYMRGACKLAGITYKQGYHGFTPYRRLAPEQPDATAPASAQPSVEKTYMIDIRGFLVNPQDWDEQYAAFRDFDMKMSELTDKHWQLIYFLRDSYEKTQKIPTIYQTCEANNLELDELRQLFPDGYHRGVVKLAGLRVH